MKLERELNVIEKLMDIYSKGKRSEALGDQARRAIYSAVNDMTSQLMRNYSDWFSTYSPYPTLKESEEVMAGTHDELVNIIRLLKEGLEVIASDDSSEGEVAVEILQSMEDICKRSNLKDIQNLPKLLNT